MNLKEHLSNPVFRLVGSVADEVGQPCLVVGGYVRDIFLERHSTDIDFVTVGSGIRIAENLAAKLGPKTSLAVYRNFGTAQVKYKGWNWNLSGAEGIVQPRQPQADCGERYA